MKPFACECKTSKKSAHQPGAEETAGARATSAGRAGAPETGPRSAERDDEKKASGQKLSRDREGRQGEGKVLCRVSLEAALE